MIEDAPGRAQLITSTAMEDRLPAATPSLSLDRPDVHARLLQIASGRIRQTTIARGPCPRHTRPT